MSLRSTSGWSTFASLEKPIRQKRVLSATVGLVLISRCSSGSALLMLSRGSPFMDPDSSHTR